MPLGVVGQVGPRISSVGEGADRPTNGQFWGGYGSHLWHCCARTCEVIKLLFGVVSGSGREQYVRESLDPSVSKGEFLGF